VCTAHAIWQAKLCAAHFTAVSFDLYYDARKHKIFKKSSDIYLFILLLTGRVDYWITYVAMLQDTAQDETGRKE